MAGTKTAPVNYRSGRLRVDTRKIDQEIKRVPDVAAEAASDALDELLEKGAEVTLTDAATIAVDFADGTKINFTVTLTDNRTLGNPTNVKVGQCGRIRIVQDGTGSRTLTFSSNYITPGGVSTLVLSTAANAKDYLYYDARSATEIFVSLNADVKH